MEELRVPALSALLRAWMLATKRHDLGLYQDFVSGIRQGLASPDFGPKELRDEARRQFEAVVRSLNRRKR